MLDPQVTVTALFGVGFAAASAGLIAQTRAKGALARQVASVQRKHDEAAGHVAALEREVRHFAEVAMPALVDVLARGHRGTPVPDLQHMQLAGTPVDHAHRAVGRLLQEAVTVTREQMGRAALSSVRETIDEAQVRLHRCQITVMEELDRHPDGTMYHQGLMVLDHQVTQALHTFQRLRILTGSWPGLQRADCTVREVVESARGRIGDYLRVSYTYDPGTGETWLEGRVVEPVTVALAELLANATSFSEGKVFVEVQLFQTGLCVVVDDGGLNMNAFQREAASQQLAQRQVLDITTVRDAGQLGFAVIGRLAGEYGFTADVTSTSPYGGVRAVLRVPLELFGRGPSVDEDAAERQAAHQAMSAPFTEGPPAGGALAAQTTSPAGLPQRRRRSPRPAQPAHDHPNDAPAPVPADDPEDFASGYAALSQAMRLAEAEPAEITFEGEQPHA
ncbi:histidine kinase [Streptomyces californicus]|uniref:histidine kinase n=1 Tax=Streptomyces californicus TaxID=67351 RepID=UPI0037A6B3A3